MQIYVYATVSPPTSLRLHFRQPLVASQFLLLPLELANYIIFEEGIKNE